MSSRDRDNDKDSRTGRYYDEDDAAELRSGHASRPVEKRAIASLVRRYYMAAAMADGGGACALMYSVLVEAIPEDYGQRPGPLHGNTCAAVMSALFKQHEPQLRSELASLTVTDVRLEGHLGHALLDVGRTKPPGHIRIRRDGHVWTIDELLPAELP